MNDGDRPDAAMLHDHHITVGMCANLINITSVYLDAPSGSGEEVLAELALHEAMLTASTLPPDAIGNLLLGLTTLIAATGDEEEMQRWFDHQAEMIREAME